MFVIVCFVAVLSQRQFRSNKEKDYWNCWLEFKESTKFRFKQFVIGFICLILILYCVFKKRFPWSNKNVFGLTQQQSKWRKNYFICIFTLFVFSKRRGRILIEGFWLSSRYQMLTLWPSGNSGSLWRRVVRRSTLDARSRFDILGNFKVLLLTVRFLFPVSKCGISQNF